MGILLMAMAVLQLVFTKQDGFVMEQFLTSARLCVATGNNEELNFVTME